MHVSCVFVSGCKFIGIGDPVFYWVHDCQLKELLLALWLCDGPLVLVNNGQFSASLFVTMM